MINKQLLIETHDTALTVVTGAEKEHVHLLYSKRERERESFDDVLLHSCTCAVQQLLKSMPNNTKTCSGCQIECCVTNIPTQCESLAIKHTSIGIGAQGPGPP